jgi:hypothetical protein
VSSPEAQQDKQHRRNVAPRDSGANRAKTDAVVVWVENHLESWRQITHFVSVARGKRFGRVDEDQFLELKGVIVQELEMILAAGECSAPGKEEVHEMMNNIPSLRYLSQLNDGALRKLEHQWHLIYIAWHASLGQLKIKHRTNESRFSKPGLLRRWWPR